MNYAVRSFPVFACVAVRSRVGHSAHAKRESREGAAEVALDDLPTHDTADEPGSMPDIDDRDWEAFIADDDERDPWPEHGDFWFERDQGDRREAG